jgi:actin-like ATPase involved in cell morphogenesis
VGVRLAIDLGSSNTVAVAQAVDGPARPLLFDGAELLPSAVYADPTGGLVVGRDAERMARADPAAFEPSPKRRIDEDTLLLGGHTVAVRDALAAVLRRVAAQAGPVAGRSGAVVLTHPAGWGAPRRAVLIEAGARAGLGPVVLVGEPVAAATYFSSVLGGELPPGAALAVVDVGGGTMDVAVVRRGPGLQVIAQDGLDVGGVDVDAALVEHVGALVSATVPDAWRRLAGPDTPAAYRDRLVLWQEVRAAKETLSRTSVAPLHVPGYPDDLHLTREELEAVAGPLLAPIGELTAEVINAAGLTPDRLAGVFLVGGASRMPLIARLLHARLGIAPIVVERPETVVAEGALRAVPVAEALAAVATRPAVTGPAVISRPDSGGPVATRPAVAVPAAVAAQPGAAARQAVDGPAGLPPPAPGRAAPAPNASRPAARRPRRWLNPTVLALVLLCFLLPFATVSCGLPAGYGRAAPDGTTTYTGLDLVAGRPPHVPADKVLPAPQRRPDRLPPQPLLIDALLAVVAALVSGAALRERRPRLAATGTLAAVAAALLVIGQVMTIELLATRIQAQSPAPAGRTARDFIGTGLGFWLALSLLTATAAGNLAGLLRRAAATGTQATPVGANPYHPQAPPAVPTRWQPPRPTGGPAAS